MPIQYINTGTAPNQGNGDTLRTAFTKINNNFDVVFNNLAVADTVGEVITHSELHRGIAVTYNSSTQQASFLVNIASASTLGGVKIGNGLSVDPVTGVISTAGSSFNGSYNSLTNIPQNLATTSTPTFADLNITGDIGVGGIITVGTETNTVKYIDTLVRADGDSSAYLSAFMGQNINSGTNASTDFVLMNDIGTDSEHYIDLGINSSNYSAAMYGVNGTNDGYLYVNGGSLSIGTQTPGTRLVFHAGGTTELDAGGHLDTEWHFNRPVIVELNREGVADFLVWNTSNHPDAASFYEARNGNGGYVRLGVNSHFATYNPDEVYLYPQGPGETFHIGNTTDIKFYANANTGNTGTAILTLDKTLQSAIFDGHVLPTTDLTYDLGSTSSQWRSIYVGTGTIYIGGVALGVNENNYVTVDGNPIITVNTAGNFTVQGDTNIVLGAVVISDTAPDATTPGSQWFNTVEARTYVAYNEQWVDSSPTVLAPPDTNPDVESITFNDATVQTTAWSGTYSYNDLTDKPVAPTFVGGGSASTWLTAD